MSCIFLASKVILSGKGGTYMDQKKIIDMQGLASIGPYADIASFALGFVFGVLILGALATSCYMAKIRALKLRILHRKEASNQ